MTELSAVCLKADPQTQSFTEHILFNRKSACALSGVFLKNTFCSWGARWRSG
jgi:hypothetical protein